MEHIPSYSDDLYADIQPSYTDSLMHHGVKGQKWGVRRYQNSDGSYTSAGRKHRKNTDDFAENTRRVKRGINIAKNVAKYGGLAALAGVGAYGAYKYGNRARNNKNIDFDNMGPTIVDKNGNVVDENDRAVIEATKEKLRSLKRKENRGKAMARINSENNAAIDKMVGKHKRQQFARETIDRQKRPQLPGTGMTYKSPSERQREYMRYERDYAIDAQKRLIKDMSERDKYPDFDFVSGPLRDYKTRADGVRTRRKYSRK